MLNVRDFLETGRCVKALPGSVLEDTRLTCSARAASRGKGITWGRHSYRDAATAKAEGAKKEVSVTLHRTLPDGSEQVYQVTDTVNNLSAADWFANAPARDGATCSGPWA